MIKHNKFKLAGIAFITMLSVTSCSKMNDLGDKFLDSGSIIYAPKADSAATHPGNGRIGIEVFFKTERTDHVEIWWDDEHFETLEIGSKAGTFTKILDLPESAYIFNIISVDRWGNKSLPFEVADNVYGPEFRKIISRRTVTSMAYCAKYGAEVTAMLGSVPKYLFQSELTYTNTANELVTVVAPADSSSVPLPGWKSGLTYRTVFKPSPAALDTFISPALTFEAPATMTVDKSTWKIVGYSSQVNGSGDNYAPNAINGRYNDRWHTADQAYPHWMTVDLGGPVPIKRFGVMPSSFDEADGIDDRFPKKVKWEVSTDGTNWTTLAESATTQPAQGVEQFFDVTPTTARYFRFTGEDGAFAGGNYMVISELDAIWW